MNNYQEYTVRVFDNLTEWLNSKGELHREDGPAVEWANGTKHWYLNGKLHREDGPALEHANGIKFWYLHDTLVSEAEHARQTASPLQTSCEGKVIEVDGKKYVLTAV